MPFCTNCGAKLEEGAKFCSNCGKATSMSQNVLAGASRPPSGSSSLFDASREDLVACLSIYAENFWTINECLTSLIGREADKAIRAIDFPGLSLNRFRDFVFEQWSYFDKKGNLFSNYCYPVYCNLLFQADDAILDTLYPKYKAAYDDYVKCWKNKNGRKCYLGHHYRSADELDNCDPYEYYNPYYHNDEKLDDPKKALFFIQRDKSDFVQYFRDPVHLRGLHEELCLMAPYVHGALSYCNWIGYDYKKWMDFAYDFEECLEATQGRYGPNPDECYISYTAEKTVERTVGLLFKRIEKSTITEDYKLYSVRDFRFALCSALFENLYNVNLPRFTAESLPLIVDSIAEIILNMKPLIQRFPLPKSYQSLEDVLALAKILQDGKADTWKEAVTLYDTESYRKQVLKSLSDIKNELSAIKEAVAAYNIVNLNIASSILHEMKNTNVLVNECKEKLSSIASSTLITAIFGD